MRAEEIKDKIEQGIAECEVFVDGDGRQDDKECRRAEYGERREGLGVVGVMRDEVGGPNGFPEVDYEADDGALDTVGDGQVGGRGHGAGTVGGCGGDDAERDGDCEEGDFFDD